MTEHYQLFDIESGNLFDEFDSKLEALVSLAEAAEKFGTEAISQFSLFRVSDGRPELVSMQQELVQLVAELKEASLAKSRTLTRTRD